MEIRLHANAWTTPKIRSYRQASHKSVQSLSAELGVTETTIRRWFDKTNFGYVHVDLKHLTCLQGKLAYVFVALERTTRFFYTTDHTKLYTFARGFVFLWIPAFAGTNKRSIPDEFQKAKGI